MEVTMHKPKVVFFGTGPVAAKSLELLAKHADIEAVVTKPKPDHHRGSFPVLEIAEELKLPLKTVANKADLSDLIASKPFSSQVGVLIDFGIIVSQDVIDYFPKGIVNSHFSLLPEWRGADPITFSILSGQKRTGVSLMLLVEKMDEGPILSQESISITEDDTTSSLTNKLIELSDNLLKNYLTQWLSGDISPRAQVGEATYSRKLTKEDGKLDWDKPADVLVREIRAFKDWPKSYTSFNGIDVIITKAHAVPSNFSDKNGDMQIDKEEDALEINCSQGYLCIEKLKPAGKKEMSARDFLLGYRTKI